MPPPWTTLRPFAKELRRSVIIVAKGCIVGHVFASYVGGVAVTTGISMYPTIPTCEGTFAWLLYSSLHRRGRNLQVGDIITYTHPIFPMERGCKRIIGMPGDFVSVVTPGRDDMNMHTADVEGKWASVREELVRVPEGHCWVQGDNLEWSRDSRLFGPLPLALVKAKVFAVVFPSGKIKWIGSSRDIVDLKEGE